MSWPVVPLGEIGDWYGGGTPSKGNASFWTDGTIPWLSPKDMKAEVLPATTDHVTPLAVAGSSVKLVPAGAVAIVVRSGILERRLPVALAPFETTLNQDMKAVVARPGIDPRWIAWGVRASEREILRKTRKAGTTVASIEWPRFLSFGIPVPPLEEQQRIIEVLEDHLSRLDAADSYIAAAQQRSAVLGDRLLESHLASVPSTRTRLCDILEGGLSNGKSVPTRAGGFPVLRLTALRDGQIDLAQRKEGAWSAEDAARFLVRRGDFLISRGNGTLRLVGRGGLVTDDPDPIAYPDTLVRARPDTAKIAPDFLALVWNSPTVRGQIESAAKTTAGIYKVNQKDLGAIPLPVPKLEDQVRIVAAVADAHGAVAALGSGIEQARMRSEALRRSVLVAAFAGQFGRPRDVSEAPDTMAL